MRRYRTTLALDDPPEPSGDGAFRGVDMQRHPTKVAPGFVCACDNGRFYESDAAPRGGHAIVRWANSFATAFPLVFPIHFYSPAGLGEVFGVGRYADAVGTEWLVFATATGMFITRDGFPLERLTLPGAVTLDGPCFFAQASDSLYCFRGRERETLVWRHEYLAEAPWISGFVVLADEQAALGDPGDGTEVIPDSASALVKADRFFIPVGRDEFVVSDVLDYNRHAPVTGRYSLDTGHAERLVRLYPFGEQTVIALKSRGIYQVSGVTGDLSLMSRADNPITTEFGLVAYGSCATVGADIFFLAEIGVTSIRQVLDNKVQGKADVLSEPITPLIDRINWQVADQAVGAFWGRCYYLAVPLDGSATNNAVLVYDVQNRAWCGRDTVAVKHFVKAEWQGRPRLLLIDYDGLVRVAEERLEDETVSGDVGVAHEWVSRGYQGASADEKGWRRVGLDVATWKPSYSIGVE